MENRIDAIYARQSVDRKNRISRSILDFATIVNPKLTALNVELALKLLFSALYAITCVPLLSVAIVIDNDN